MIRLPDTSKKVFSLALSAGVLLSLLPLAGAQTRRPRTTRRTTSAAAKPSPTPVVVPRIPAAGGQQQPAPPVVVVPSAQDGTPPPPKRPPTPTPTPTPDPSVVDESEVVRVTSNLVVVPVSVTDASGQAVQGLTAADFRLEEEARAQELAAVGTADEVPLDIALIFDVSSSITQKNFDLNKQSAVGFLKQVLKPVDRAAVFLISEKPRLELPLTSAGEATAKLLPIPAADKPTGTAFYDTVKAAANYLNDNAPGRNRRVILVISDGEDNFSDDIREAVFAEVRKGGDISAARASQQGLHQKALDKVLREVQRADAVFYSINPSGPGLRLNVISQRAQDGMRLLAETTGGNSFVPESAQGLAPIFRQIAAELRAQYLLQYLSNNEAQPGKFLRIKVLTPARPDLRIRARQGYYKKGEGRKG